MITPDGALTTLHSFDQFVDGSQPYAGLTQGSDGDFYGTTFEGGTTSNSNDGTIFRITPGGALTTLYNFCDICGDGRQPRAAPIQDTNGNFYGTASTGGIDGYGTVYRLSTGLRSFVETQTVAGGVGASVKILGTNLTGAIEVRFNGTVAAFRVVSSTEIASRVPTGASSGTVTVVTPGGTLVSNAPFQVLP